MEFNNIYQGLISGKEKQSILELITKQSALVNPAAL